MRNERYWFIEGMKVNRKTLREIRSFIKNDMNLDSVNELQSYYVIHVVKGIEVSLFTFFRIGDKIYITKIQSL